MVTLLNNKKKRSEQRSTCCCCWVVGVGANTTRCWVLLLVVVFSTLLVLRTSVGEQGIRLADVDQDIPAFSRSKEPELRASSRLSPTFIERLPTLPITFKKDCALQFSSENISLCIHEYTEGAFYRFAEDLVKRLLEHRFECDASQLRLVQIEKDKRKNGKCLWVQSTDSQQHLIMDGDHIWGAPALHSIPTGVHTYLAEGARPTEQEQPPIGAIPACGHPAYLLPFVFQDFYPLPTRKEGTVLTFCFIPDPSFPSFPEQESMDFIIPPKECLECPSIAAQSSLESRIGGGSVL